MYMTLTASDRRLDRFGTLERCVICKSIPLLYDISHSETCIPLIGLPLSVRRTIFDFVSVMLRLTTSEVKIFGRTDKVSLK